MKKISAAVLGLVSVLPAVSFAANVNSASDIVNLAVSYGNTAITLLISFAVIYLIYSIVRYFIAGDEEGKKKGKTDIFYGIIGLAIILSIWGIVFILTNTFQVTNVQPNAPRISNIVTPL